MVQKRETKAINKLCVREILSLSFVCGAYFFQFRGRNLVCFVIAYNFNGKYAPEAGKTRMRTAFFTRATGKTVKMSYFLPCSPRVTFVTGEGRAAVFRPPPPSIFPFASATLPYCCAPHCIVILDFF